MISLITSHSFELSLSLVALLLTLPLGVESKAISVSMFPNSACSGGTGALVGIGRVVLSSGELETHCGCPTDNLPNFTACPASASGDEESVCHSQLDLSSGTFTATCSVIDCTDSTCPTKVVNTVVVDDDECSAAGRGALGYSFYDGEAKCSCSAGEADFTVCPSPANGRGACITIDSDFLGSSATSTETVKCDVVCDQGFFATPHGSCIQLTKRQFAGPSAIFVAPSSPSATYIALGPSPIYIAPTDDSFFSGVLPAEETDVPTPTSRQGASASAVYSTDRPVYTPGAFTTGGAIFVIPTASPTIRQTVGYSNTMMGATDDIPGTTRPIFTPDSGATNVVILPTPTPTLTVYVPNGPSAIYLGPSAVFVGPSAIYVGPSTPGASARARLRARAPVGGAVVQDVIARGQTCGSGERSCSLPGGFGVECVKLDSATQCGGCHSTHTATNCEEIIGAKGVSCLRRGCVVRSCQDGYVQTDSGVCSARD